MSILDTFFRCNCPVTSALDIVGDKWTLVVIKLNGVFGSMGNGSQATLRNKVALSKLLFCKGDRSKA